MISIDIEKMENAPNDWNEIFDYKEDVKKLIDEAEKIGKFKNIVVVGNGGSITSYDAYYAALLPGVNSETVWTMDPELLKRIKEKFSTNDTVVVAVSKSGNTLGQIESLLYFKNYPIVVVTDPDKGTLSQIAEKLGWNVIVHPPVGGRFSGGTSSTLVSAVLAGMNIEEIQKGIAEGYGLKDEAYSLAKFYFEKEKEGYNEVYVTCYSERLRGFENLIVQLMHESVCKDGAGQTFYFAMGPEAQHHTNQRFLGGKKNVIGTFITAGSDSGEAIEVPDELSEIDYKGKNLGLINGIKYQDALNAEYLGTKGDADEKSVPNVTIDIDKINEKTVGEMVAFWHLVAFYSSLLRGVNPFDQPAVERSKDITLDILLNKTSK